MTTMPPYRRKYVQSNRFRNAGAYSQFKRQVNEPYYQRQSMNVDGYRPRTVHGSSGRANFRIHSTDRLKDNYHIGYTNRGFEGNTTNNEYSQRKFIGVYNAMPSSSFRKPDFRFRSIKRRLPNDDGNERERKIRKLDDDDAAFLQRIKPILKQKNKRDLLKELNVDSVSVHKLEIIVDYIYRKAYQEPNDFGIVLVEDLALFCKECKEISVSRENGNNTSENCTFESLLLKKITREFERLVRLKQRILEMANRNKGADKERKHKWIKLQYKQYLPVIRKQVYGSFMFILALFRNGMMSKEQVNSLMKSLVILPEKRNLECLEEFLKIMGREHEFKVDELVINHPNPQFVELFNSIRAMIDEPNCKENKKCILMKIVTLNNTPQKTTKKKTVHLIPDYIL